MEEGKTEKRGIIMKNKKRNRRMIFVSVLCVMLSVVCFMSVSDAKTKTKGKLCKGVNWSYNASNKTLTISGKGHAKISGFLKKGST